MGKLGMKPVTGINRVTIKKAKAVLLYIEDPEILKSPGADNTYVVFGEVKLQDYPSGLGAQDVEKYRKGEKPVDNVEKIVTDKPVEKVVSDVKEEDESAPINEEGLNAADIDNIMEHSKCTRRKAVKALREANGDSVTAIINLAQ